MGNRKQRNTIGRLVGGAAAIMLTVLPSACLANGQKRTVAEGERSERMVDIPGNVSEKGIAGNTSKKGIAGNACEKEIAGNTSKKGIAGNVSEKEIAGNTSKKGIAGNACEKEIAGNASMKGSQGDVSQNEEGKMRTLTFEKYTHDFGTIRHEDGAQECSFKYTNKSDTTILIFDVRAYCNCTKAEWSKKPIKPGESGEIKVRFENNDKPQNFSRSLKIILSSDENPILLTIRGKIVE